MGLIRAEVQKLIMQRHRFFAPPSSVFDSRIILDAEESHHLVRVLRLLPGATVFAFDGKGTEYECQVERIHKTAVELKVIARLSNEMESPLQLTLGQALIKGDKFDWVIQKATELGTTRIVPLITEHSEIRKSDNWENRLQRWRRIALEATKQCGRRKLLEISEIQTFDQFCIRETEGVKLLFAERSGKRLHELSPCDSVSLAIGPEGGWSDTELKLSESHGFQPVSLGARILRAETAAIAAVTSIQFLWGDLG